MSLKLTWNRPLSQIVNDAVGGADTALFAASEMRRLMDKFVPMDTGSLKDNVNVYVEDGSGIVHYLSPYAHRMYEGDSFNFSTEKHPLATSHWDNAMMQVHGKDLIGAVQKYVKRGK